MNKKKTLSFAMGICALTLGIIGPTSINASNDNWAYSFTIKPNQANSRSDPRYRETTNDKNQWKVRMTASGEGTGTITRFWLEIKDGTNVSPSVNVKQAYDTYYYRDAYSNARKTNVYLTAENNNYNNNTYAVSGSWDEEVN